MGGGGHGCSEQIGTYWEELAKCDGIKQSAPSLLCVFIFGGLGGSGLFETGILVSPRAALAVARERGGGPKSGGKESLDKRRWRERASGCWGGFLFGLSRPLGEEDMILSTCISWRTPLSKGGRHEITRSARMRMKGRGTTSSPREP